MIVRCATRRRKNGEPLGAGDRFRFAGAVAPSDVGVQIVPRYVVSQPYEVLKLFRADVSGNSAYLSRIYCDIDEQPL